ncbi:MAG: dihydrodipicolinate synthase family protein [Oscillospiraceae bacterium]|nr:dihydrodipicolinate synthase family protein [Oscillospiraceae bacterium]
MPYSNKREVWPVMLTPFTATGSVDYAALGELIEWYIGKGVSGLFAVCQSSEMFYLSLKERVEIARFVKQKSSVPVIASGHVSYDANEQLDELNRIADTGADAVILITNRMALEGEGGDVWLRNLEAILNGIDSSVALGLYECPYPYKRLLSTNELKYCAASGRFRFLKDTCCDISVIKDRLATLKGSRLDLFNANTATLLMSLQSGAAGFSGVMANFHPELYTWLVKNAPEKPREASIVQAALTMCSYIEKQVYPVNAKYHQTTIGNFNSYYTRTKDHSSFSALDKDEVSQMAHLIDWVKEMLGIE